MGLGLTESVPDHSSLSRIRKRLPLEVYHEVFGRLQKQLAGNKLFSGKFLGVDSSTLEIPCCLSRGIGREIWVEWLVMLEHAEGDMQQFSHAGAEYGLGRFALRRQALGQNGHQRVAPHGGHGLHVQQVLQATVGHLAK